MNDMVDDRQIECDVCEDTGFERFECTGDRSCGRRRKHAPHDYVKPCACRPMNRNYQDKRASQRRQAA